MKNSALVLPLLLATLVSQAITSTPVSAASTPTSAGKVRFFNNANWEFDPYLDNPTFAQQEWMKAHYYRMGVHSPYFDTKNSWYPGGLAYLDSYGIAVNDPIVYSHPEWIMKDARGNKLYIPWACNNGACSQFAGNFSNAAFRQYMIQKMQAIMAKGYRGLWLDDVNFTWRVSDGWGNFVVPIDNNTGTGMTLDSWRLYFAQYLEQVRAALPTAEIAHNVIWFSDSANLQNPYITREIDAADYINLERGGNDDGLVGGGGPWGFESFLKFVDYVHSRGADVIIMDSSLSAATNLQRLEYGLATWLILSQGNDLLGNIATNRLDWTTPNSWWSGYDLDLGNALNARYSWNNLFRRDFQCGMVLLNQPDMPTRTITLGSGYKNMAGQAVTSVTLAARQAAVLSSACTGTSVTPTPAPAPTVVTKIFQQGTNGYAGTKDTTISSWAPTTNRSTATAISLRGGASVNTGLVGWDISSIPQNAIVQSAKISFNVTRANTVPATYEIYQAKRSWVENQATWNNFAAYQAWALAGANGAQDRGTAVLGTLSASTLGIVTVNLNSSGIGAVQSWISTPSSNQGVVIMDTAATDNLVISSKEATNIAARPTLSITYKLP